MAGARLVGLVGGTASQPQLAYLADAVPVGPALDRLATPALAGEVFRVAAPCAERRCQHFDGRDCGLATRIVQTLPVVVQRLPRCAIRPDCRWWRQEGRAACLRCPQVVTERTSPSEQWQRLASPSSEPPRP